MKRSASITTTIALSMAVAFAGCNSQNSNSAKSSQTQQDSGWALTYKADCSGIADVSQCSGAYGLTLKADGTYEVGPGPNGQILREKLDAEDFAALNHVAGGFVDAAAPAGAASSQESCNAYYGNEADYTLTLTRNGKTSAVLAKKGQQLCSSRLDQDGAEGLHEEIVTLAEKYYPSIFPDACFEAAGAVSALYPAVQDCKVDADCTYLDLDYQAIAANSGEEVYADNCSVVKNLPAANAQAVKAHLAELQAALQKAQQACGTRIVRDGCNGIASFPSTAAAAVCQQGVCRVNPSLGY